MDDINTGVIGGIQRIKEYKLAVKGLAKNNQQLYGGSNFRVVYVKIWGMAITQQEKVIWVATLRLCQGYVVLIGVNITLGYTK